MDVSKFPPSFASVLSSSCKYSGVLVCSGVL